MTHRSILVLFLARCVIGVLLFGGAMWLMWHRIQGWGWLLAIGVLAVPAMPKPGADAGGDDADAQKRRGQP